MRDARNNAAEVALAQQHHGAAAAAVAHLRSSHVLALQRAHCTECFHRFRSAYVLETALSMRASRWLGCQEADGSSAMPSFQHCLLPRAE